MRRFLQVILSKLLGNPLSIPLSPRHRHALVVRDEMDEHPINDPNNWLPKKRVDIRLVRSHLWRQASPANERKTG